ncbi:hypothetical protein XOC_3644 [Xanthomonas oryzae pv. oryzicola BLS256]|uniref:Uncharacterized protein n=1 Tax=Xanthomonas oryzae pv. oryzicola (strain BLS256) TaxID=383407 RepID=G7TF27_XANOB|nr:hypothetical protein XOC_3644 [Xanthomonas oryzae pv. oryzicola BLS256]QEO96101.1 hypothetical protein XOCgx_1107 [Xanthomonas oryzae pv. oryzicola]
MLARRTKRDAATDAGAAAQREGMVPSRLRPHRTNKSVAALHAG